MHIVGQHFAVLPDVKDFRVAAAAFEGVGDHAIALHGQAARAQPGRRSAGQNQNRHIAGQTGTTGEHHIIARECGHGFVQHGDTLFTQQLQHALVQGLGIAFVALLLWADDPGHCGSGHALAHRQGQFKAFGASTDDRHAQRSGAAQATDLGPYIGKAFQRRHKQTVLARTGHGRFDGLAVRYRATVDG